MSTRSGENKRARSQKHQNKTAWNAYDKFKTDPKSKIASGVTVTNCCSKCTEVIDWKIRYGKYKPLTKPAKCTRCSERRIKSAYHILCISCVELTGNCAKCGQKEELVNQPEPTKVEADRLAAEIQKETKALPERKRRSFLRYLRQQEKKANNPAKITTKTIETPQDSEDNIEEEPKTLYQVHQEALSKLKELKEKYGREDDFDIDFDSDLEDNFEDNCKVESEDE